MMSYICTFVCLAVYITFGEGTVSTSGFSVFLGSNGTSGTSNNDTSDVNNNGTVLFNNIILNDGDDYSADTGRFKAPVNGVYLFSWWVGTRQPGQASVIAELVVKDVGTISAHAQMRSGNVSQAGNTAVLALREGNEAWIQVPGQPELDNTKGLCTFSGALISAGL